ncbi:MAG: hypothetical protein KatS3mg059_0462 [Thermomicrobiales bacterium]|nr:MAG: hypothetical protein KatS3mg059_0462 [Thermomicrobiales bacterium]
MPSIVCVRSVVKKLCADGSSNPVALPSARAATMGVLLVLSQIDEVLAELLLRIRIESRQSPAINLLGCEHRLVSIARRIFGRDFNHLIEIAPGRQLRWRRDGAFIHDQEGTLLVGLEPPAIRTSKRRVDVNRPRGLPGPPGSSGVPGIMRAVSASTVSYS